MAADTIPQTQQAGWCSTCSQWSPKGRPKGKQPKLSLTQRELLFDVQDRGEYTQTEIAELFNVSRATVYRELRRRRIAFLDTFEAHIF